MMDGNRDRKTKINLKRKNKIKPTEKITNDFIERLKQAEAGDALPPWVQPWRIDVVYGNPINALTNKPYSGINSINLSMTQDKYGFTTPAFITFRQAKELCKEDPDNHNLKGAKACGFVVKFGHRYYDQNNKEIRFKDNNGKHREPTSSEVDRLNLRKSIYQVPTPIFNIDQLSSIPSKVKESNIFLQRLEQQKTEGDNPEWRATKLTEIVDTLAEANKIDIKERGTKAFFSPALDYIQIPTTFKTEEYRARTLLHEAGHWTGGSFKNIESKRLGRDFTGEFGSKKYAVEELTAELTSAQFCREYGCDTFTQHTSYIGNWLTALGNDKSFLLKASKQADQAYNYLKDSYDLHLKSKADIKATIENMQLKAVASKTSIVERSRLRPCMQ